MQPSDLNVAAVDWQKEHDALIASMTTITQKNAEIDRLTLALAACQGQTPPPPPTGKPKLGAYVGNLFDSNNPNGVLAFELLVGAGIGTVLIYDGYGANYDRVNNYPWIQPGVKGHRMMHSPDFYLGFSEAHLRSYCTQLINSGQADAIHRPFWEMNGSWFKGWAAKGREAQVASEFRRYVTIARSVPNNKFEFDWCPCVGDDRASVEACWPGRDYVNYVGLDIYGQDWSGNPTNYWMNAAIGLNWHRSFAAAQGRKRSFPEWGVIIRGDGAGLGDYPPFMDMMIAEHERDDVAYGMYFNNDLPWEQCKLDATFPKCTPMIKQLANV